MNQLQYGVLANSDASFRGICMFLAQHPSYASMPFRRAADVMLAVQRNQAFGAIEDGLLVGIVLWSEFGLAAAQGAIATHKMPPASVTLASGDALAATAFIGKTPEIALPLWKAFVSAHRGRPILYERHRPGHATPSKFKWIDRTGVPMGADV